MRKILFNSTQYEIYQESNNCFLDICNMSATCRNSPMHHNKATFQIDYEAAEHIAEMLNSGYRIRYNLRIINPNGEPIGTLKHHIISNHYSIPIEKVLPLPIHYQKRWGVRNRDDLRVDNLVCSLIPQRENISIKVWRKWDELLCMHKSSSEIYYCDYSDDLDRVLQSGWFSWHHACRNKSQRLAGVISGCDIPIYLYQLVMIEALYGLPLQKEDLIQLIHRFKAEYSDKGLTIDHLDDDPHNNRLSNLFIMPRGKNGTKGNLTQSIPIPYFWNSKRIDSEKIYVEAGHGTQITIQGSYNLSDYLSQLRQFTKSIKEESATDYQ